MQIQRKLEEQSSCQTKEALKNIIRDKEGRCITIKGSTQEADVTIIDAPSIGSPHLLIRQLPTTLRGEIDSNTVRAGNCNTPLTAMDRSSRQKINKDTQALNDALDQMDLIAFIEHSIQKQQNTSFSRAHRTFSRADHILGHKSSIGKFKKTKIISGIFSHYNTM